jgi:glycosyltransferase involved in cell wall biosynthesis
MSASRPEIRPLVFISSLVTGGAERVTVSFVRSLSAMGMRVSVCTVTSRHDGALAGELTAAGVVRHDLGARRLADPRAPLRLARLLEEGQVNLIHAHGQDASILAAAIRPFSRARLVVTRHVLEEPAADARQRLRARLACASIRSADTAVAVSSAAAERLAALARLPREAIEVIPNGIDLERFDRSDEGEVRRRARQSLGIEPDQPVLLVPAVLRAGKGHEVLLDAVPLLRARVPSMRVLIAGGGELEAELRARAAPLGEAVRFLGPRDDMSELLAACDVVALPSLAEALPTALMEAAAAGRPAVATRVGGVPEVVEHARTGLLVPAHDARALGEAIATLLTNVSYANECGVAARRRAREGFGIDRQVERTLSVWSRLVAGRPR